MLPCGTRFLGVNASDRDAQRANGKLSRLLPLGGYHAERSPERFLPANAAAPLHAMASHTLPIGWEQRIERPSAASSSASSTCRIFFIDHAARATTLVDPRTTASASASAEEDGDGDGSDTAKDAWRELLQVCVLVFLIELCELFGPFRSLGADLITTLRLPALALLALLLSHSDAQYVSRSCLWAVTFREALRATKYSRRDYHVAIAARGAGRSAAR